MLNANLLISLIQSVSPPQGCGIGGSRLVLSYVRKILNENHQSYVRKQRLPDKDTAG